MKPYWAVVPAAGVGKRMLSDRPKQYLDLNGLSILEHTLTRLVNYEAIKGVIVATSDEDEYWPDLAISKHEKITRVSGGAERCYSVLNGLEYLIEHVDQSDWVMVHDAARPCLRTEDLDKLLTYLSCQAVGGLLGVPVSDTIKQVNTDKHVEKTVDRSTLWRALTPQMFHLGMLYEALADALDSGYEVTDEASAIEFAGFSPIMVEGYSDNIKVTRPEDLPLAELIMRQMKAE